VRMRVRAGHMVLLTGPVKAGILVEGEKISAIAFDTADASFDREVDAGDCS